MEAITMRAGVAVAACHASPALALAAQLVTRASAAPTADGDVGFVRPLHSLHVRCPCCCVLTRLCLLVASMPVRDLLLFAKDLFVAAKNMRATTGQPASSTAA